MLETVPPDRGGIASGALNTARQLGYVLGIAALGLVCNGAVADRLLSAVGSHDAGADARTVTSGQSASLLAHLPANTRLLLGHAIQAAFAHGLDLMLLAAAGAGLAAATMVALALRPRRGPAPGPGRETRDRTYGTEPPGSTIRG
jgi:hypothetical protein